jgi:uncharacterized protein
MRFFVMGGTGFIGGTLLRHLVGQGHGVTALTRPGSSVRVDGVEQVEGDVLGGGAWQGRVREADAVINLVGSTILTRWTDEAKRRILQTRVLSTERAVESMRGEGGQTLVCGNAIGFYGDRGDEVLVEGSGPGQGFLTEVCVKWQEAARKAEPKGHRTAIMRVAPVLGQGGGVLGQMLPVFRKGAGGRLGKGTQWFSWVHIDDLVRAFEFAARDGRVNGPVNVCAPHPVTNAQLTATLAEILNRPAVMSVPAFALRLLYGEGAQALLSSQRCIPGVLQSLGFEFGYWRLDAALKSILGRG